MDFADGTDASSLLGEPPIGRSVVSAGSDLPIADGKIVERCDPNGHLDLAPDRRLADLELSGADCAALA
jgi:hypothetical protein